MSPQPPPYAPTRLDPLSYAAPSRIRAFLCPVGPVSRPRFLDFVQRLEDTAVIRLGDVSPDPRPERVMFSPLGFPDGILVYNFTTVIDTHHAILEDIELSRRTLAAFGLADYNNIHDIRELTSAVGALQAQHPQAAIHKVIIFDCPLEPSDLPSSEFICVPPERGSRMTSMRTVLGDLTSALLAELPLLAKLFEAADTILSPQARDDDYNSVILHSPHVPYSRSSPSGSTGSLTSNVGKDTRISYPLSHHSERQRMRRKGRSMKMIAHLYLLAGRTHDAMREYVDALNVLKGVNDHLWHASSIEGIGVCMLILSHLGVAFTIPPVVLPQSAQPGSDKKEALEPPHLLDLLPHMTNTILSLYTRSQNFPGEGIPRITYVQTILRTANLLTCTCLAGGWTTSARAAAVLSRPIPESALTMNQLHQSKMNVLNWITAAQAVRLDGVEAVDVADMLTGIATACGRLGLFRKRAFVLRQLVLELTPRIFQARQLAQSRRSLQRPDDEDELDGPALKIDYADSGILSVLNDICEVYGVLVDNSAVNPTFGWPDVKTSILKTCIGLCQVLPDQVGIVRYTSLLFKLAAADLSIDEQLNLGRSMREAYKSAQSMGAESFEDEYWDPYLVRDIAVVESSLWAIPKFVAGEKVKDDSHGPFIYNPFAKKDDSGELKQLFVLNEPVEFKVLLQNPFAFELEIKAMSLVGTGASFSSDVISLMVPPRKLYPVSIYLTPTSTGTLLITGCSFQVYGCRETIVSIRPTQTPVPVSSRLKASGLDARSAQDGSDEFGQDTAKKLAIDVIPALPVLRINRISLPQASIMLLEGERRRFVIALGNVSEVPVSSISLKFSDSTTESLTAALNNGKRSDSDRYEIEVFLYQRPALVCVTDLEAVQISPNGQAEIEIEVYGKRGLTSAGIEISYSHVPESESDGPVKGIYVRTLSLDINVTVNSSIDVAGCDFVPFSFDMPIVRSSGGTTTTPLLLEFLQEVGIPLESMDEYCLMLIDLRNSWPSQLEIDLRTIADRVITKVIQPGHVARLLVPIKRIGDIDVTQPVPSLSPPKQFTLSDNAKESKKSTVWPPEVERMVYWYREELLKLISSHWRYSVDGQTVRDGVVELRALRITPQMVDIVRVEDVVVDISIADSAHVQKCGRKHWFVEADSFVSLVVAVTSHSKEPVSGILRIQPALRNLPASLALDINLKIIFNGILQRPILDVAVGETRDIETDFVALVRGEYEFVASFEDTTHGGTRYVGREKAVISVH